MATNIKTSWTIYNAETVKRLQEEDPDILPTYSVDSAKDLAYNKKQVNAAVTSAIIQGKSIDGIASDLSSRMASLNESAAIKTARTAVTNAQNAGNLSAMKELAAMGVEVQKEWVATLDSRTRLSHRALDGQRRDLDEAFSNGLQYPGDSSGNASEVWRCRCTMTSYLPKYDSDDEPRVTYEEWLESRYAREVAAGDTNAAKSLKKQINRIASIKSEAQKASVTNDLGFEVDDMHPKTLGGVQRTAESMSFEEADGGNVNPGIELGESAYEDNCQTCVVAMEARIRGYNVIAKGYSADSTSGRLGKKTNLAWIDPSTGKHPTYIKNNRAKSVSSYCRFLEKTVSAGERYTLQFSWKDKGAHIVNLDRDEQGILRIKDNQRSVFEESTYVGSRSIADYLKDVCIGETGYGARDNPKLLRIDNMQFYEPVVNKILEQQDDS